MKRRADVFFLPKNAQSTRLGNSGLFGSNAGRRREEKTDFVCPSGEVKKTFNHAYHVTAVTDGDKPTLLMCGYSAISIFEFATGFSSGKIQVDSRPSLYRAGFSWKKPRVKRIGFCRKRQPTSGPYRKQDFFESIQCSKHRVLIHSQLPENGNEHRLG